MTFQGGNTSIHFVLAGVLGESQRTKVLYLTRKGGGESDLDSVLLSQC